MDNTLFQNYIIEERSFVSFIKRELHNLLKQHFTEMRTGEIDIVISEMCTNLIKHAGSGELLYRLNIEDDGPVFEILCIDNGPGIKDLGNASKDGFSTKNTLGQGLGAIMRLSNFSQVYTQPDWGTIVYSKFYKELEQKPKPEKVVVRSLNVAKPGERVSGDGSAYRLLKDKSMFFAGDGLGHGMHANEAVSAAIAAFNESMSADPADIIKEINRAVKKTRGLVATVAVLDHDRHRLEICGVGNISTRLQQRQGYKTYICNNGIVGLQVPERLDNYVLEMEKYQLLIFCSDGIKTRWDLAKYPSLLKYDPMITAAALFKDHARKTDDMSILIVKVV